MKTFYEVRELCEDCSNLYDHTIEEAEYKVEKLNLMILRVLMMVRKNSMFM